MRWWQTILLCVTCTVIGILGFSLFIMSQKDERPQRHQHGYNQYDQEWHKHDYNQYDEEWQPPTTFKTKLSNWASKGIVRQILENIPGFDMILKQMDEISTVVHVALDAVLLPFEAIRSIHQWFNGQISGRRCAKTVVDACASIIGGISGATVGAGIGAAGGLVGSIVGGIIGGLFGSSLASTIMSHLTERIFDLPKSIAVERAYNFLGKSPSASNYDINNAFRRLAQHYHPDTKYGDKKLFMELQSNMQLIHEDRKRTFRS